MMSKTLFEEKTTTKRNKMLDEFGKAKVVFHLPIWGVFHREPSFVPPNNPAPLLPRSLRSPDRWAAPPDRVRRSDMSTVELRIRHSRLLRLAPTGKFVSSNVQITRLAIEKAEVTQGRRPTRVILCRYRFYD